MNTDSECQVGVDIETLRRVLPGLEALESQWQDARTSVAATERGYFTPDEDDRVRQMLLSYRNYRFALYEIIYRCYGYPRIADHQLRLRTFLVGFATSLTLYSKSLKLIQAYEREPLVRKKLNEPDAKFEMEAGFFDELIRAYSSLGNYREIMRATWFWLRCRRELQQGWGPDTADWPWLVDLIVKERAVVRKRLAHVLLCRLRYDWRAFLQTALRPVRKTRYSMQALVGNAGARLRTTGHYRPALKPSILAQLRPLLRPGDILLIRAEKKLTSAILPGFWAHAALYVGDAPQLRELGLSKHPYAAKHLDDVERLDKGLGCVIEAVSPRVQVQPLHRTLFADHVLALRPALPPAQVVEAVSEAFGHVGKPYDFEFDFNVSTRMVCTELIYRCYHHRGGIEFPLIKRLGRYTLSGDDIANLVLLSLKEDATPTKRPFDLLALILSSPEGQTEFSSGSQAAEGLRKIQAGWRPGRTAEVAHA